MNIFHSLGGGNDEADSYITIDYPERNWIKFNKQVFQDENLSGKLALIGFYAYLCTHDKTWRIRPSHVMKMLGISKNTYYKYTNELVNYGYLHKERVRDEEGKFCGTRFLVFSSPENKKRLLECDDAAELCSESPVTKKWEVDKSSSYIDNIYINKTNKENKNDSPFFSSLNDFPEELKPLFSEIVNEILKLWPDRRKSSIEDCAVFLGLAPQCLPRNEAEVMNLRLAARNHLSENQDNQRFIKKFVNFLKEWRFWVNPVGQSSYREPQLSRAEIQFREFLSTEQTKDPHNIELFKQAKQDEVIMRQVHNALEHLEKNTKKYFEQEYIHCLRLMDNKEARS